MPQSTVAHPGTGMVTITSLPIVDKVISKIVSLLPWAIATEYKISRGANPSRRVRSSSVF